MSEHKEKEKLLADSADEMARWGNRPIILEMDITRAMVFCGALQLALRHPGFATRPSAGEARSIVFDLANQIPEDFPALRKMIMLGFHSKFDC